MRRTAWTPRSTTSSGPGNLAALREIGLRFVAERVGSERGGVQAPPEDVIVAVSGRATAEQLIRRAVRLARRRRGMCTIVHVHEHATSPDADDSVYRRLAAELQCVIVERDGVDIAQTVIAAARERSVRHVVIGEPKAAGLVGSLRPNIVDRVVEGLARRRRPRDRAPRDRGHRGLGASLTRITC